MKKGLSIEIALQLKEIGEKVRKHRQAVNGNYKTFSTNKGINNMTLWRIEKGDDFKFSTLLEILNGIGISTEDFFNGIK